MQLIDYGAGIYALDANYARSGHTAIHLIVDDGRVAFIDTGVNASLPQVQQALEQLQLAAEAVEYVILTHVHLDHAGGAGAMMAAFPAARLAVHPRGARHMIDPSKLMAATEQVYGREQARRVYGELLPIAAERVISCEDDSTLTLGRRQLAFHDAPGHARHHHFIHDRHSGGVFSGDAFGISYPEFAIDGHDFVFPTTTPTQFDPVEMRDTVEAIIALEPSAIYPTHFRRMAAPRRLAAELLRRMDDFVGLALKIAKQDAPHAELEDLLCTALADYMRDEVRAHGATQSAAAIDELFAIDNRLNAQGLLHWASANRR